jgi:hypothetical protein
MKDSQFVYQSKKKLIEHKYNNKDEIIYIIVKEEQ